MSSLNKLSLSPFGLPSPTLAHVNRMLSTTSGQDKPLMLISCTYHATLLSNCKVMTELTPVVCRFITDHFILAAAPSSCPDQGQARPRRQRSKAGRSCGRCEGLVSRAPTLI